MKINHTTLSNLALRWVPSLTFRRRRAAIQADHLVCLCGLKRSGLHAIIFWLLGQARPHALVNNSPEKRLGNGSAMSRTIQTSPLPVRVQRSDKVSILKRGVEQEAHLPQKVKLLVVLFQSQHIRHLHDHIPLVRGVEAQKTSTILLLRDPFNWAASYMEKSQNTADPDVWPRQWQEYADEYVEATRFLPDAVRVNYNRWFTDPTYRRNLSEQLGLKFSDAGLNVITPHGSGSSFDQDKYQGRAQAMQVLERWKAYRDDPRFREVIRSCPDIVERAEAIFALPAELKEFIAKCRNEGH